MRICTKTLLIISAGLLAAEALAQKIGQPAPEINVPNYFGTNEHITLARYRGKIVVLVFWRTDDTQSLDAIKTLNEIHDNFGRSGVEVLAVTSEPKERTEETAKGREIKYAIGYGGNVHELYEVSSFPRVFLIDPSGIIVWKGHPEDDLKERIRDQIARTPPAGSDPAALKKRYDEAQQLKDSGDVGRAYVLAREVAAVADAESDLGKQAKTLREDVEKAARDQLEKVREAIRNSNFEEASKLIAPLAVHFAETDIGRDAEREVERIRADSTGRGIIEKALRNVRGQSLADKAAAQEQSKEFLRAIDLYREVSEKFSGTEAAEKATAAIDRIKQDPEVKRHLEKARGEAEADRWLDLGERFVKVEMIDMARQYFEKIIKEHPDSKAAARAKDKLKNLKG